MTGPAARVAREELDARTREDVLALAAAASRTDGATSLSEDAVLRLERGRPAVHHLLARDGGALVGYAQLATAGDGFEGELLVDPAHRRRGHGTALLAGTEALAAGRDVRLWSHGDTPGAAALAARRGWARVRELLRMERRAAGLVDLPVPDLPPDVRVRPLVPGADDDAWVALNAAAFATHPEQGRWTAQDLRARYAEDWFDPSLLLLAEAAAGPVGFCWMKVEDGAGELYVLGVSPARAGAGLGRALLVRGLRAVAGALPPSATVDLYVDGDNAPAVRLYTRLGFGRAAVDVQYASPAAAGAR
ncbi:mycothiol synthase [Kineococcus sp. SYSU DK002]|uniref:mycothiol synthase n=1 Tax=Kineococcus sp. SYSU DK002 TaxID=3383123 RepID=UPI003D7CAF9E